MQILNTAQHTNTSVIVEPFGADGAARIVPVDGDTPGKAFIMDARAVAELASFLSELALWSEDD